MLRDYQTKLLSDIRDSIRQGHRKILACAPVGSGKAVCLAAMAASAHSKGKRVLILAGRIELVRQAARQCVRLGVPETEIGIQCGDEPGRNDSGSVQVCSVQTLLARGTPTADLVIVDECKHSTSQSWLKVINSNPSALVVGFDATPIRYDNRGLGTLFTSLVQAPTPRQLIDMGYLCEPVVYRGEKALDLSSVRTRAGEYVASDLDAALDSQSITGDAVALWKQHAQGLRTLAFAVNVKHSLRMRDAFREAGIPAEHVDANTPREQRQELFARLQAGEYPVLCNVMIAGEGTDLPAVKCVISANPTKSLAVWLQMVGRCMRIDPQNPTAQACVLDLADNATRHGLPADDHEWTLEGLKPRGVGDGPVKSCQEESCKLMSPTAARYCRCGSPFYPKCPKCKKRYDSDGAVKSVCPNCEGVGIWIENPSEPPTHLDCPCCKARFVPYRDIVVVSDAVAQPVTPETLTAERVRRNPPTEPQVQALRRLGVDPTGLDRRQASAAIDKAIARRKSGPPSSKQAWVLRQAGMDPHSMTFAEASAAITAIRGK